MTKLQSNFGENVPQNSNHDGYAHENRTAEDAVKSLYTSGENLVRHLKEDTAEIATGMAAEGKSKMKDARVFAAKYMKNLEEEISERPVQSVAIAFAIGAVVSLMLGRR
jgi:ElaB/YqjD/DUF883 family membrane-anchored ribosome-binding protein